MHGEDDQLRVLRKRVFDKLLRVGLGRSKSIIRMRFDEVGGIEYSLRQPVADADGLFLQRFLVVAVPVWKDQPKRAELVPRRRAAPARPQRWPPCAIFSWFFGRYDSHVIVVCKLANAADVRRDDG
jgi:hypothetical protein